MDFYKVDRESARKLFQSFEIRKIKILMICTKSAGGTSWRRDIAATLESFENN